MCVYKNTGTQQFQKLLADGCLFRVVEVRHRRRSSAAPGLADHGPGRTAVLEATAGRQPASAPGGDSRVVTLPVGRGTGRHRTPLRRVVKKKYVLSLDDS